MKILLLSIPLLFCVQDSVRVDTIKFTETKMFFEQRDTKQNAKDINIKLDSLLLKLEARNDSTKNKKL